MQRVGKHFGEGPGFAVKGVRRDFRLVRFSQAVSEMVKVTKTLKVLGLRANKIGDDGAKVQCSSGFLSRPVG